MILAIDPGPEFCGVVVYCPRTHRVLLAASKMAVAEVLDDLIANGYPRVAIERVQSYGIAGGSLLRTAEVVGRLQQRALDVGSEVTLHYRREVLRHLDVTGKGNRDSLVRNRLLEMFGGTKDIAVGNKKNPGPLHGVSSHAWAALAVAVTAAGH